MALPLLQCLSALRSQWALNPAGCGGISIITVGPPRYIILILNWNWVVMVSLQ